MSLQDINKQAITVRVQTKITFGKDTERHSIRSSGWKFSKGGSQFLQFIEENEAGRIQTTIKCKDDETLLLRNGAVKMRQLFRTPGTTHGHYESIYGTLELLTRTDSIEHLWDEETGEGSLKLVYMMQMQGAEPGRYEMIVSYKEDIQ